MVVIVAVAVAPSGGGASRRGSLMVQLSRRGERRERASKREGGEGRGDVNGEGG